MRVEVKDYVKTIGKATVLNHVSYTFESGKIYGLRGKKRFRQNDADARDLRID